jgi:hypothetical protein
MATRPVSVGNADGTTTSADPDVLPGVLVLIAAAAGLVLALAAHVSSGDARHEPELTAPDPPKH